MLTVCSMPLPATDVTYMAFRLAFFDTLERIELANQVGLSGDRCFGYLTEVPFLKLVPPHVQLDQLLETWSKHQSMDRFQATLADEAVIYAVCETSARVVSCDVEMSRRFLRSGPRVIHADLDSRLAAAFQALHLNLPNEGDFLLVSQFLDMPPDEGRTLKAKFGMLERECDVLFDLLGRWNLSAAMRENGLGLITVGESVRLAQSLKFSLSTPSS